MRRYSSDDPVTPLPDPATAPLPLYWYRPPQALSAAAGHAPVHVGRALPAAPAGGGGGGRGGLPIAAVPYNTAPAPTTPWVAPGTYTVKLTVDGKSYTQPITVKLDPRVKTPALVMQQVYTLSKAMYFGAVDAQAAAAKLAAMRAQARRCERRRKGRRRRRWRLSTRRRKRSKGSARPRAAGGAARGGQRGGAAVPRRLARHAVGVGACSAAR